MVRPLSRPFVSAQQFLKCLSLEGADFLKPGLLLDALLWIVGRASRSCFVLPLVFFACGCCLTFPCATAVVFYSTKLFFFITQCRVKSYRLILVANVFKILKGGLYQN